MSNEQKDTAPRGVMRGGGDYDRHSRLQAGMVELARPCLEHAAHALGQAVAGRPVHIADYGTATGRNSIELIRFAAALFEAELGREPALELTFCDLPDNDWNELARRLHDAFGTRADVQVSLSPRSFFGPVLAAERVDLAWSATAVHWLGRTPAVVADRLWPHPALAGDRAPFTAQAGRDWECFLRERARELRPHGRIVVTAACAGADGSSPADHYLDVPWQVIDELVGEGALQGSERARMFVPIYFRNAAEYRAPFATAHFPLELVEYREAPLPDVLWQVYERTGDGAEFARAWVGWLRAFSEPLLEQGLDGARAPAEKQRLLGELYRRVEAHVAAEPERARVPWRVAVVYAARRG